MIQSSPGRKIAAAAVLVIALLSPIVPQAAWTSAAAPMAVTRLRIGVVVDGIVRLTPAGLTEASVDPASVDPRTFALSSQGHDVAIRVTGESDGHFDSGDTVEFFGQRFRGPEMDQKYTDENVYWLDFGGPAGPRIADVDATPQNNLTPPSSFPTTLRAEENMLWWTLWGLTLDTQDTWFWDRLQPQGAGQGITHTLPYTVPDPAAGYTATLRLEEISRPIDAHRTTIGMNGTFLDSEPWFGKVRKVFTNTLPAGLLVSGTNTVTVGALNEPGALAAGEALYGGITSPEVQDLLARQASDLAAEPGSDPASLLRALGVIKDDIQVNYWEVDYRRQFRAWQDQLDFRAEIAGTAEYSATNWASSAVGIWDISDPLLPRRLTGASASSDGGRTALRFRAAPQAGDRFWLQAESTYASPARLRLRPPTDLRDPAGGADAVIVTHADLRPAAERLAAWHLGHGRRVLVADAQDVYDEFNNGIFHPKAIQAMLIWAQTHWAGEPPAYLTLVGDSTYNFKRYNPAVYGTEPVMIPPYLAFVDPWQGEVPADSLYGDLNGDGLPEMAVGRLSVNTLEEAYIVVDKIVAYDERTRVQPWQRRAVFVADDPDSNAGDFHALSDEIIQGYTPSDMSAQRIYLEPPPGQDVEGARTAIAAAVNDGALMVQYTGHGAPERWAGEAIWRNTDTSSLHNSVQFPIVMSFNCLDGFFHMPTPGKWAMAEVFQRQSGGGTVAAISPSGLGLSADQAELRKILLTVIFKEGVLDLGRALTLAKQRYNVKYPSSSGPAYLLYTMMLFGDPAMQVPAAPLSDLAAAKSGSDALLTWTHMGGSAVRYEVWRSASPYFVPRDSGSQPLGDALPPVAGTQASFVDPGALGATAPGYFYQVLPVSGNGIAYPASNRAGIFRFALVPGGP